MQARELVSAGWILLVTFLIGLPIVFVDYGGYGEVKEILLLLYLFLEFLPMVVYILAILIPTLSPHLLLPWVVVNVILLLVASILALSLSIPNPTLPNASSRGHGRSDIAFYEQSIADLQQQVANLQGSTNYSSPVGDAAQDINGVGYSS